MPNSPEVPQQYTEDQARREASKLREKVETSKQIESIKHKERFGKKVKIRMLIMRHGEKISEAGELSEEGKRKLFEQFKTYVPAKDKIKLSSTNVKRNIETLRIIEGTLEKEKIGRSYIDTALSYSPEKFGAVLFEGDPDFSDKFADKMLAVIKERGEDAANQFYLDFERARPDEKTISPREMASRLAKRLLLQAKIAKRLYSGSEVDYIQISGTPPVFSLLKELIPEQIENNPVNPEGKDFVEKMGGKLNFGEGIIIEEITDEEGNLSPLKITFRGKEYKVGLDKLEDIAKEEELKPKKFKLPEDSSF